MKRVYVVMAPDIPDQAKAYGLVGAGNVAPVAAFETGPEAEYCRNSMREMGYSAFILRVEMRKYSRQWMAAHPLKKKR